MLTQKEAQRRGKLLLRRIKFPHFKLIVHENIGWHYSATNGLITVNPCSPGIQDMFFALLVPHYSFYGHTESFGNPNKAILSTLSLLVTHACDEIYKAIYLSKLLNVPIPKKIILEP